MSTKPSTPTDPLDTTITFGAITANAHFLGVVMRAGVVIHTGWKRYRTADEAKDAMQKSWERVDAQICHQSTATGETPS